MTKKTESELKSRIEYLENKIKDIEYGRLKNIECGESIKIRYAFGNKKAVVIHNDISCKKMILKVNDFLFTSFKLVAYYDDYYFNSIR